MRTEVKLSKRLERIASFVQPGSRVADIGTDHGYQGLPSILEGLTSALLIRKAGVCTRRNQKFLILGGML